MTPIEPVAWLAGLLAGVQEAAPPAAFRAVEAAARPEAMVRGLRFLAGAYTAVWVILAGYLLLISVRQRRLERQIRRLRERLGL